MFIYDEPLQDISIHFAQGLPDVWWISQLGVYNKQLMKFQHMPGPFGLLDF